MIKKLISFIMAAVTVISVFTVCASAADTGFDAVISIPQNAKSTDAYAANRLEYYLDKITGGNVEIADEDAESGYKIKIISEDASADLSDGSYTITSTENELIISGAGNKGAINGVYRFLEEFCGCHWYESEVIVIPENKNLTIPSGINIEYAPFFEYTETDTVSATAGTGLTVTIEANGSAIDSGDSVTWASGDNTVVIEVSNGVDSKTYTVTVTAP